MTATNSPVSDVNDDGITAIFSTVSGDVTISNIKFTTTKIVNESHTVAAQITGTNCYNGDVNITFNNVDTYGSVSGLNINNNGLLLSEVKGSDANITMIGCDNYANLMGNGFRSVYLGNMGRSDENKGVRTITATNCHNYGTIVSKNKEAAMFISNPGYTSFVRTITIDDCSNKGNILQYLDKGRQNLVVTRNDSQYKYTVNGKDLSSMTDSAFNMAIAGELNGNLVQTLITSDLATSEGKFVLNSVDNATKYELCFAFTAGGVAAGGGAGYTMTLTPEQLDEANINVYDWINLTDATDTLVAHSDYKTTYYTSGNHYVYNRENSDIRGDVFVTFTAFGENNTVLSLATYQYHK